MKCPKCSHDPLAIVTASWPHFIDREVESGNRHTFNVGASRWRYGKSRDTWQLEFRNLRLLRRIPRAMSKRRVTLTRYFDGRQREWDLDNFATGAKLVVDAMVREGLLVDDAPAFAEIHYVQTRSSPRGLRVLIEEFATHITGTETAVGQ